MNSQRLPAVSGPYPAESGVDVQTGIPTGVFAIGRTGDARVDGILSGYAWAATRLNYSAPDAASDYGADYPHSLAGLKALTADRIQALHFVLNTTTYNPGGVASGVFSVEAFTNLSTTYTAGGSGAATLRYASKSTIGGSESFLPAVDDPRAGDAFFNDYQSMQQGGSGYLRLMREVGHTLGLGYTEEPGRYGPVPTNFDTYEYTVMSSRAYPGGPMGGAIDSSSAPQTWMMLDIAALQHMYGADYTANSGNTVYTWGEADGASYVNGTNVLHPTGNKIFMTIWDGGGQDTYDLSNYATNLRIDLTPGGNSLFSEAQRAAFGNGYRAEGNVYNAMLHDGDARSLIENAVGGSGKDTILGNAASNILSGNGGADQLYGQAGDDILDGGAGDDQLNGNAGNDDLTGAAGNDFLDGGAGDDFMGGGTGNDTYAVDSVGDFAFERPGEGTDIILSRITLTLGADFENLTLVGPDAVGGTGNGGANRVFGNEIGNTLKGLGGADLLSGAGGTDFLLGGDGNDRLIGGTGADVLIGGRGADIFVFELATQSAPGARDILRAGDGAVAFEGAGAAAGDRIDLSAIDANTARAGDQAFSLGGTGVARLSFVESGTDTIVRGNTDGDAAFEFQLVIEDGAVRATAYTSADFLL